MQGSNVLISSAQTHPDTAAVGLIPIRLGSPILDRYIRRVFLRTGLERRFPSFLLLDSLPSSHLELWPRYGGSKDSLRVLGRKGVSCSRRGTQQRLWRRDRAAPPSRHPSRYDDSPWVQYWHGAVAGFWEVTCLWRSGWYFPGLCSCRLHDLVCVSFHRRNGCHVSAAVGLCAMGKKSR